MPIALRPIIFLVLIWTILFPSLSAAADPPREPGRIETVSLQLRWFHQFQFAGYYAAVEKGFFAEEGLNVVLKELDPNQVRYQPGFSTATDYGVGDASLLQYRLQGEPVVLLAQIFQHSPLVLLSARESGLVSPEMLAGKKVMMTEDAAIIAMFETILGGMSSIRQIPQSYDTDDLFNGRADAMTAYLTDQPFRLKQQGKAVNIINPRSYGVDFYGDNLFTSEAELRHHPQRVEKVLRATLKGWYYALLHPQEIIDLILKKYPTRLNREELEYEAMMTAQMILPDLIPLGEINLNRFQQIADIYARQGLVKSRVVPADFIYREGGNLRMELAADQRTWLGAAEQAWIREHPRVHVGIPIFPPLSFADDSGRFVGITADYLHLIEEKTGLIFEPVFLAWPEILSQAKQRKIDLFAGVATQERMADFDFTRPFFHLSYVIINRLEAPFIRDLDSLSGQKVTVIRNVAMHKMLELEYPELEIRPYDNLLEALQAVSSGRADVYVGGIMTASYLIQKNTLANLKVAAPVRNEKDPLSFAVRNDWPALANILDKAIMSITPEQNDAVLRKWLVVRVEKGVDWSLLWQWVGGLGGFLLLVISGMVYGNRQLKREVSRRTEELNQANRDLAAQGTRLASIINGTTDAVFIKNRQGQYVVVNDEVVRLFGKPREEILGRDDSHFFPSDEAGELMATDRKIMNGEEVVTVEEHLTMLNKATVYLATKGPIHDEHGSVSGLFGISRNITEIKNHEDERVKLERQLQQAQKMESIGHLAGGVAHDFNNMLSLIIGHAQQALRKAEPSQPDIKNLRGILNAAERSAELTRQLLTFARKQAVSPRVLDLNATVAGMLNMLQRLIGENIQLSWNAAANLWPVKVDPSQIDQILANLCVNARDAISGVGKVTIETGNTCFDPSHGEPHPEIVAGDYVRLTVSDTGCGMGKEIQEHIFEPFYTTKDVGAGSGLGLAMVHGAVRQNNGFITVISEPEQGSTFHIYLPRENSSFAEVAETKEHRHQGGCETLLLVEDDETLLELERSMLEESGYKVLAASSAVLAQSLARQYPDRIDLLVSDVIMPVMNGKDLRDRLLTMKPEMKVLFLSGYTDDIISDQSVIEEGIHFLQKPFSFESLTGEIRKILDGDS